ncbi:MAG TPA: permease-like cell division protein FtsX [Candidatus Baltobacteraceae bacterium]|jgi:cell division transport system permease protein|nr:permease-like cell division protein FtsX [Candidatus Baltobacteraceae bacterium]
MDWGNICFFWAEVWRSFTRNLGMQVTAIGTVALMIIMLGSFLFAREALMQVGDRIVQKFEISAFLTDNSDAKTEEAIRVKLSHDARIRHVTFISKDQGLKDLQRRLAGQIDIALLTENPLPDAFRVQVVNPDRLDEVASDLKALPGVASVEYAQDVVRRTLQLLDVIARIGIGLMALMVATAAIVISNTIRLTVFARRREIAIMRLVGASSAYVRGPFIVEGMLDGIVGAALALGLLALAEHFLIPRMTAALPFIPVDVRSIHSVHIALELLGIGIAVGMVASWHSVGRYLRT